MGGFIAAASILQLSYTFLPVMFLGFQIKKGAFQSGEEVDPATLRTVHVDGGMKRWTRGEKQSALLNSLLLIFFSGSLTTAVLGLH